MRPPCGVSHFLLNLQHLVFLTRDGIAAFGERVRAVGLLFSPPSSKGAAWRAVLIGRLFDRELSFKSTSCSKEPESLIVAFSWNSLNSFPIETLDFSRPSYYFGPNQSLFKPSMLFWGAVRMRTGGVPPWWMSLKKIDFILDLVSQVQNVDYVVGQQKTKRYCTMKEIVKRHLFVFGVSGRFF